MVNFENGVTPINDTNLNKMQTDLQQAITDLKGTVLYEDSTGTTEDIILNDLYTNYKEIEIIYKCTSAQLTTFNSKRIAIVEATQNINLEEKYIGSTYIYIYNAYVSLAENNKIVFNTNRTVQINAETFVVTTDNPISIVKVIGYKEA